MPRPIIDLTGQRFGRLVALQHVPYKHTSFPSGGWRCKCDCGNTVFFTTNALKCGSVKSCGCYAKERTSLIKIAQTHGMSRTRIYITWRNMRVRCTNPKDKRWKDYGGRGITVCEEWKNNFKAFFDWAMSHGYEEHLTIDRIDVNGNYCPENCRFITRAENNKKRRKWKKKGEQI